MHPRPSNKKFVPFTETEWKYVQRTFMSDNVKDLQRMVALMSMWICRMQHDTPVIIGISEMVLRAHLNAKNMDLGIASVDKADLGQIYGSTITRFVNFINEMCQQKTLAMSSIASAVGTMGIPQWVVSIRHQATHDQMPPLNLMKEAIAFCRCWLWRKHWSLPFNEAIKENLSKEAVEKHRNIIKSVTDDQLISTMFRFREWRKRYRSLDHFHSIEGRPLEKVRTDIEKLLDQCPNDFLLFFAKSCLARCCVPTSSPASLTVAAADGVDRCSSSSFAFASPSTNKNGTDQGGDDPQYLIDEEEEFPSSLFCIDQEDASVYVAGAAVGGSGGGRDDGGDDGSGSIYAEVAPLMHCDVMSRQKCMDEITGMEQNYYRPVLILINNKGCLQRLLVELTRLVAQGEMEYGELRRLAGWANLLLHSYLLIADAMSIQNWRLILKHTVLSPQFFKDEHINKLLDVLGEGISDKCRQRLIRLLKIHHHRSAHPQAQNGVGGRKQSVRQQQSTSDATVSTTTAPSPNNNSNILDLSIQTVKSLTDLQERIRSEDVADSTFVCDPLTLEDAWAIAQPEELGPLGLTSDQRADTLCLTLGACAKDMLLV